MESILFVVSVIIYVALGEWAGNKKEHRNDNERIRAHVKRHSGENKRTGS